MAFLIQYTVNSVSALNVQSKHIWKWYIRSVWEVNYQQWQGLEFMFLFNQLEWYIIGIITQLEWYCYYRAKVVSSVVLVLR